MIRDVQALRLASAVAFCSLMPVTAMADRNDDFPMARPAFELPTGASEIQAKQCAHGNGDIAIHACDWVIASGRWDEKDLAWAYFDRGIEEYMTEQDDKAIGDFTHRIKLRPDDAIAYRARGNVYRVTGKLQLALEDMNTAVKLKPDEAKSYMYRGLVESSMKQNSLAMADFNKAIEIDPKSSNARAFRGAEYYGAKNYDAALSDLNDAIALGNDNAITYRVRGDAYRQSKQYSRAIEDYDRALKLKANYTYAFFGRGLAFMYLQQYPRAVADFDAVIRIGPVESADYNNRCWIRALWGREYDLALADCGKAITLRPHANPFASRAFVYLRSGKFAEAISDGDAALKFDGKDADALFVRGAAKRKLGDAAGGDADIAAAKAIDPKIADTYAGYGVTP
jgi:tetratricopeptide (TPR) repeat protein